MNTDAQQLKILSIFHYVAGGVVALFSLFPVFHLGMGLIMLFAPSDDGMAPRLIGLFFSLFAGLFMIGGWTLAACIIAAGRFLALRRRYLFCLIVAGVECAFMPFGTVLGVFTIIVLMRESVRSEFGVPPVAA